MVTGGCRHALELILAARRSHRVHKFHGLAGRQMHDVAGLSLGDFHARGQHILDQHLFQVGAGIGDVRAHRPCRPADARRTGRG